MWAGEVLVEIQPDELKFTFELKKQTSCSVKLVSKSKDYVAFKVKTTSPKRYCVRPNTGIILPRSTCDFTVTMQAPKEAPPDMQLKDKFLVQCTVVPYGTTEEDIVPSFFSKENGRYIQENKLRVVLLSPPHSPVLEPINGALRQEPAHEIPNSAETAISNNGALKQEPISEVPALRDTSIKQEPASEVPILRDMSINQESASEVPILRDMSIKQESVSEVPILRDMSKQEPASEVPILRDTSISNNGDSKMELIPQNPMTKDTCISSDLSLSGVADSIPSYVARDIEDLMLKINNLEVKLNEAEKTITNLRNENSEAIQFRDKLQQETAVLRRKSAARVRVGFPFLFVIFMAIVGMELGYLLHS